MIVYCRVYMNIYDTWDAGPILIIWNRGWNDMQQHHYILDEERYRMALSLQHDLDADQKMNAALDPSVAW